MSTLKRLLATGLACALLPAAPAVAAEAEPAIAGAPTGFWTLRSAAGDCDGLDRAAPEAHFTPDGRFSFASRSYVPGGADPDGGCCAVRWGRTGLWRSEGARLRLEALSIPAEFRASAPLESVSLHSDGTLEVRIPESSCTLGFVQASGTPDQRHAQTPERLQACVNVQVTRRGAGPQVAWGDLAQIEMRVRSPAALASSRAERSTVEPGSHLTWATIEHAIVGHPAGTRLRVAACPELTLAGIPPEQMPTVPIVVDLRILSRSAGPP